MLRHIGGNNMVFTEAPESCNGRYKRNEKDDVKSAIEYLYDFKKKLEELHPIAFDVVHKLLQETRY